MLSDLRARLEKAAERLISLSKGSGPSETPRDTPEPYVASSESASLAEPSVRSPAAEAFIAPFFVDEAGAVGANLATFPRKGMRLEDREGRECGVALADRGSPIGRWHFAELEAETSDVSGSRFRATGGDPRFVLPSVVLPTSELRYLYLEMRAHADGDARAQIFWGTSAEPNFCEKNSAIFPVSADGAWRGYVLDLRPEGSASSWDAPMTTNLRLDPLDRPGSIEITNVALLREPPLSMPSPAVIREGIANRFLAGRGLEVGALHNPLVVPRGARVRYVDRLSVEQMRVEYAELGDAPLVSPSIIAEADDLSVVPSDSEDFLIANHVLEHMRDPIGALREWLRVIMPGGALYLAIPDHENPFDHARPVTTLEHLRRDYEARGRRAAENEAHYREWVENVHPEMEVDQRAAHLAHLLAISYSIHFHVFDGALFTSLLAEIRGPAGAEVVELVAPTAADSREWIAILRRKDRVEQVVCEPASKGSDRSTHPLIRCPDCGGVVDNGTALSCTRCASTQGDRGRVLSLISGGARTALDDIDYDKVYSVDAGASERMVARALNLLDGRVPNEIDSYLEIGAGTGLFTLGFLSKASVRYALITDISEKMLGVCRQRLVEHGVDRKVSLEFATWDGVRPRFNPSVFDVAAGSSVLHHVLDYPRLLELLARSLKDDGIALFLEPNYRFHSVMIDFVSDIVCGIPRDGTIWTDDDYFAVLCWLYENNTNLRFRGDPEMLAEREDKHLFEGGELRRAARASGFGAVRLIPFGGREESLSALQVYSSQLGLRAAAREDLLARFERLLPGPFAHLAEEDRAPSFLVLLEKMPHGSPVDHLDATRAFTPTQSTPHFRFDLQVTLQEGADKGRVARVDGWLLGDVDATYLVLRGEQVDVRFPICRMRPDVQQIVNSERRYPVRRALFSGVQTERPLGAAALSTPRFFVLGADGREWALPVSCDLATGVAHMSS